MITMSSSTTTSPGTAVSSRSPVQPPSAAITPVPLRNRPTPTGPRTPRQSTGSSGGRTLPVPGGGNASRSSAAGSNRAAPLQPLMESLPSNHRHGTAHRVCCCIHIYVNNISILVVVVLVLLISVKQFFWSVKLCEVLEQSILQARCTSSQS